MGGGERESMGDVAGEERDADEEDAGDAGFILMRWAEGETDAIAGCLCTRGDSEAGGGTERRPGGDALGGAAIGADARM